MQDTSWSLVEIIARERAKFVAFVRRTAMDLSQMDAEDVVADVLYHVWNRVDLTAPVEDLLAYLYTAFRHRIIDLRRRKRPTESLEARAEAGLDLPDLAADPETLAARRALRDRLQAALAALPAKQRAVWIATEIGGHTFAELADAWGEPLGTLLARKSRAVHRLQTLLTESSTEA